MDNKDILLQFKKKILAIDDYNSMHGNIYIDGKNYILASQAIKLLEEICEGL